MSNDIDKQAKEFLVMLEGLGVPDKVLRNRLENKIRNLRTQDKVLYNRVLLMLVRVTDLRIKELDDAE